MRIFKLKFIVFSVLSIVFLPLNTGAYDNDITHRLLNETAVKKHSDFNTFLKTSLGFKNGIYEEVGEQLIWEWIREGGYEEDEPDWRSLRHFHDPLKNWDDA